MELQAAALAGLLTLAGAIVGALVTVAIESRRMSRELRVALFHRRFEGYAAVVSALSNLHDWMIQACAPRPLRPLTEAEAQQFHNESVQLVNAVASAVQTNALALDQGGMRGITSYLGLVKAVADREIAVPSGREIGERFGDSINACHQSLSIPHLARSTYRELSR